MTPAHLGSPFTLLSRSRCLACAGEYDLRGVRGNEPGVDARFQRISLEGTCDTPMSQHDLDRIAEQASQGGWRMPLGDSSLWRCMVDRWA